MEFPQRCIKTDGKFKEIRVTDQLLGRGGFGSVWLALGDTGEQLAVKRMQCSGLGSASDIENARREYDLLRSLDHPNIVKVHYFTVEKSADQFSGAHALVVMEYIAGGSIADVLRLFGSLPERAVRNYAKEILEGLDYLHSHNIIHRDIKPANIMVTTAGEVKLTDFGLSRHMKPEGATVTSSHGLGTYPYMSPAQVVEGRYSKQSDLWAVGCAVLEMTTSHFPWSEKKLEDQQYVFVIGSAFASGERPEIPAEVQGRPLSESIRNFILKCWDAEKTGEECTDLMKHNFLTSNSEDPTGEEERVRELLNGHESRKRRESLPSDSPDTAGLSINVDSGITSQPIQTKQLSGLMLNSTAASQISVVSRVEQPCGELFRMDEELTWDTLWHRIGQLGRFTGTPFLLNYSYLFPLIRYLMCYASDPQKDTVHYIDDYRPLEKYFGSPENMIEEIDRLNKMQMFEINSSTSSAERSLKMSERGSMLIRPSKSNRGTLAMSVKYGEERGIGHFFIMPTSNGFSLNGFTLNGRGSPVGATLLQLVCNLQLKFPEDFIKGCGQAEIPHIEGSVYGAGSTSTPTLV